MFGARLAPPSQMMKSLDHNTLQKTAANKTTTSNIQHQKAYKHKAPLFPSPNLVKNSIRRNNDDHNVNGNVLFICFVVLTITIHR